MKSLDIRTKDKNYQILIGSGILSEIPTLIEKVYDNKKIVIVTDENVNRLYGEKIKDAFDGSKFSINIIVLPAGEKTKSFATLEYLYAKLVEFEITRTDLIIAFGGGVIGDVTGFCASTFLRGVRYVQIPTTLLAQVDSSIGGKVAVDLPQGKNLVGSFYHPELVIMDTELLKTLSHEIFCDGMAEVIKHSFIEDKDFYNYLLDNDNKFIEKNMEYVVYTSCEIKKKYVEEDEKDTGLRMKLNFGHTFGHAIEKYFKFEKYTHGHAISIGMYYITQKSEMLGLTREGTLKSVLKLLDKFDLDVNFPDMDKEKVIEVIKSDKKNVSDDINLILLSEIGKSYINKIPFSQIHDFI